MDYSIRINEFEGPLDLLLHLIKQSNIDIYDISIDEITKQYLDYLHHQQQLNINIAASYLVMASELMEIKSKSLLPKREEEVEDDYEENTKENLIKKLIEYKKYKEVTKTFSELELERKNIYIKPPELIKNYFEEEQKILTDEGNVDELVEAFKKFLERKQTEKPLNTKITAKEYDIKKRKRDIKNILLSKKKIEFEELFEENNRGYIVVTFISILEMVKEKEVDINQSSNFDKIYIELKDSN